MAKKAWPRRNTQSLEWLYSLDSYTNAEFGVARTMAINDGVCVACDARANLNVRGMCARCEAKRVPDPNEVVLFRPARPPFPPADSEQ